MTDLNALIERLSRATGGSREFDALIECEVRKLQAYALGLSDKVRAHWNPVGSKGEVICTQGITCYHAPMYSTSIDAAMTLVPEGYAIRDWMVWPGHPVELTILETFFDKGQHWHNSDTQRWAVKASTPAIALCIAALSARTRAATGESGAEDHSIQKAGIDAEQSVTKPSPAWREDLETSLRAWDAYDANCTPEKIVEQANSMAKAIRAFLQADSKHGAA